jgi:hypothetical protein
MVSMLQLDSFVKISEENGVAPMTFFPRAQIAGGQPTAGGLDANFQMQRGQRL